MERYRLTVRICRLHVSYQFNYALDTSKPAWHGGKTPVSGRRTFPVPRSTCSWWVTTYVGKPSAIRSANKADSAFHPFEVDKWVVSWSRCTPPCSGDAIWWMLTKWMQNGSFHSWINVWVADKSVWTPCCLACCHAAGHYSLSVSVGQSAFHFLH